MIPIFRVGDKSRGIGLVQMPPPLAERAAIGDIKRYPLIERAVMPLSVSARKVFAAGAHDDMSAFILQDFLAAGFREVEWRYGFEEWQNTKLWQEMGSVCPVCFALDGQRFKVKWLLDNMHHNAPKYSMSHVNCACQLYRINRTEELLDYSEGMEVAPGAVPDALKEGPIDLGQVPEDQRGGLGLPPEQNDFTDIAWMWDPTRNEFVPQETLQKEEGGEAGGDFVFDPASGTFIPGGS